MNKTELQTQLADIEARIADIKVRIARREAMAVARWQKRADKIKAQLEALDGQSDPNEG